MDADRFQFLCLKNAGAGSEDDRQIYTALGLAGEAGEIADLTKKFRYHGHDYDREKFALELGDALWYLTVCASSHGFYLSEIMERNVAKLAARYPDGFSQERSRNRAA